MVAVTAEVTAVVVTVKFAVEPPEVTSTLAGTVADELLLVKPIVIPPAGARALRVTVPVDGLPPATVVGFTVSEDNDSAGVTVSCAVLLTPL